LVEAGAKVAITGRDKNQLVAASNAIDVHPIQADVAQEADVLRSYTELFRAFDHLDILVNNAGIGVIRPLVEMDRASVERVFATNVVGAMLIDGQITTGSDNVFRGWGLAGRFVF
jgi:NAD(P)-dependent dehydrogenase (short-subunit alcohol dehydrogenase family)